MYCSHCGQMISDVAVACPHCGAATAKLPQQTAAAPASGRDRTAYILLGALLGLIGLPGIHNLYAGYTARGLVQLLVSICTCWLLWIPMYIWAIVEICVTTVDADGRPMR